MTDEPSPKEPSEPATDELVAGPAEDEEPVAEPAERAEPAGPAEGAEPAEPVAERAEQAERAAATVEAVAEPQVEPHDNHPAGHGNGGGAHSAAHGARQVGGSRADRNIVIFGFGMLLCAILVAFVPDIAPNPTATAPDQLHGRIVTIVPGGVAAASATVSILDGDRRGDVVGATLQGPTSATDVPVYAPGDEVVVAVDTTADGGYAYSVVDRWRLPIVGWLLAGFVLALIAFAGWAGLRTVTALAITLAVVVRLLVPLLLAGYEPVVVVVALGIVITILTLLLTHGLSRATGAAIAGTTAALLLTGGLAVGVSAVAQFSLGQGSEEIAVLGQLLGGSIDLSGLLLAAVVFGGLGVMADVAVSQAVTVDEFARLDGSASAASLFRRAMDGGVAHLAAAVNTLVLAYVGAALPVVVILALQVHRLDLALNDEHVAVEVVRTFVGGLGVVAAVPLTTAIAAILVVRARSARRRAPRVMAVRLNGAAARPGLLQRLRERVSSRGDATSLDARRGTPDEPSGRRRSARPVKVIEQPVQTELDLLAVTATKDEAAMTPPVPPTQPVSGRRPRPRRPGR